MKFTNMPSYYLDGLGEDIGGGELTVYELRTPELRTQVPIREEHETGKKGWPWYAYLGIGLGAASVITVAVLIIKRSK